MRAAPQFARMMDERGLEVQPEHRSQSTPSELLPLTAKSDAASEQFLSPSYHQLDGVYIAQLLYTLLCQLQN